MEHHTQPTSLLEEEGVRLNNEGCELARAGRFDEAIPLLTRALDIKEKAHGQLSVTFCVSLSNYADCLLGIGDLHSANEKARLVLDISIACGFLDQAKFARDILKDISVKAGTELLPDEIQDFGPTLHLSNIGDNPNRNRMWTESPCCRYLACPNITNLKLCARCRAVVYCSKVCQKADWKDHKRNCHPLESMLRREHQSESIS